MAGRAIANAMSPIAAEVEDRRRAEEAVPRRPQDVGQMGISQRICGPTGERAIQAAIDRMPREHLRKKRDDQATEKERAAVSDRSRTRGVSRRRQAPTASATASQPGSSANSRFCQRMSVISPARTPSTAHCAGCVDPSSPPTST